MELFYWLFANFFDKEYSTKYLFEKKHIPLIKKSFVGE
jgi:hypothetical protein